MSLGRGAVKVFGIGCNKTGTSSLGTALERLGYRVCHGARPVRMTLGAERMLALLERQEFAPIIDVAAHYDAFADNPWFVLYRQLDRRFDGSKFILTVREESQWLESAVRYYGRSETPLRRWIYGVGSPVGSEQRWLERYRRHNDDVREYFAQRSNDLLVVDWERGSGWPELGRFLERDVPDPPFPHIRPVRSSRRP